MSAAAVFAGDNQVPTLQVQGLTKGTSQHLDKTENDVFFGCLDDSLGIGQYGSVQNLLSAGFLELKMLSALLA